MSNDTNEKDLIKPPSSAEADNATPQSKTPPPNTEDKPATIKKKRITQILLFLCIGVVIASAVYIVYYIFELFSHQKLSSNLKNMYADTIVSTPEDSQTPSPTAALNTASPETDEPVAPVKEYTQQELLLIAEEQNKKRFASFLEINSDFRGVILIDGLGIELPYVHYSDNVKYLDITFEGKRSDYGTVFLSCDNDRLLTDKNNVLFGHHIINGNMFAPLLKYRTIENVTKAPTIVLDDLTGRSEWLVFAAYVCEPDYGYINTKLQGEAFADLLDEINSRSLFHTNVDVTEDDQILTLSTCTYEFQDARFAVHARRMREGEQIPELTVEKNPKPKQASIPKLMKLSALKANRTAVMQHPKSLKTYYYQVADGGIEWYVGNSSQVQGTYSSFQGKLAADSRISAICEPANDAAVLAVDRLNGKKGVYILRSRVPNGTFRQIGKQSATPTDVDARYPLLVVNDKELWLLYVVENDQQEQVYRINIDFIDANSATYGEPECILSMPIGVGIRPIAMTVIDGNTLLTWHETSKQQLFSTWLESPDHMVLPYSGDADRVTVYGALTDGKLRMMTEKGGKLSPGTFDTTIIPRIETPLPLVDESETGEQPVDESSEQFEPAVDVVDEAVDEVTEALPDALPVIEDAPVEEAVSP